MKELETLAVQLWAIGDAVRLKVLAELPLVEDCSSRSNVTELSERLGIPQPTVSHHLRVLRQAGIIRKSKNCRDCFYYIDTEAGAEVVRRLSEVIAPRVEV
jgi:DNA-binding transcriptional ArsR family regulator